MQRRRFFTANIARAASLALVAGVTPVQAQQVVWEDVYGSEGRYRVRMPKGYRYLRVPGHGATVHSYVFMLPDKVTLELLDVTLAPPHDVPTGAALSAALLQAQAGMSTTWPGATVLEQREIVTGPLTGRDFTLAAAGERFVRVRLYMTRAALYTQVAQGPASERSAPMVAEFFDSLRFA
jgi:hypothetical protein